MLLAIEDTTERERFHEALLKSERRLQGIVDTAADAIVTLGEQGVIDSFNMAAERLFGYSRTEAVGQNFGILVPSSDREGQGESIFPYLETGDAKIGIGREFVGRHKDGSTFPIELALSEQHDGTRRSFTAIIRDISERQALQREILTILSQEQRRIGHDLHDSVGQNLTALGLLAGSLAEALEKRDPTDAEIANRVLLGLKTALDQIRKLSKGLLPVEVDTDGLRAALAELAETTNRDCGIECDFGCDRPVRIEDNETATHLYRIAQEAVSNALKHGAAGHVRICLSSDDKRVTLSVQDDGKGISPSARRSKGMGLKTMQYRASLIGAALSIAAVKAGGTLVTCRLAQNPPVENLLDRFRQRLQAEDDAS